ncbi:hypothetical protein U14_04333 [Candidatus Moduliflexus flocculans]|uniref:Lipoprotein n=1 Tax=Candidatus Moduliflexus flocculans TaxID=1499966 RepID=A0A0S6W3N8_9BACT|nr:hypothetical protein U14_04333 [Candidatus Moduliflexus flocculans]
MKGMLMILILSLSLLVSSCSAQKAETTPEIQQTPLKITSSLLKDGVELFAAQEMTMPLGKHRSILAKTNMSDIVIRTSADFTQVVKEIASPEDALAYVRLITSEEIRPFLQDVYYAEVHKQAVPTTKEVNGEKIVVEDIWFAVEAKQYDAWKLAEPVVKKLEIGGYAIERFVAAYPKVMDKSATPAQLLKIRETVGTQGAYTMEILAVIAEGDAIEKMLLFTK